MAWSKWCETDSDCCQHIRKNGLSYEMIQAVWLDRTTQDKADGLHEWTVVKDDVHLDDREIDSPILCAIRAYGYTIPILIRDYGEDANDIIAECLLEETSLRDACAIGDFDSFDGAKEFIEKYIKGEIS